MKFVSYSDIGKYIDDTMDFLLRSEVNNNLIIANMLHGREGADTSNWLMAAVKDDDGAVKLAALMTPPYNLILSMPGYDVNDGIIDVLAHGIAGLDMHIPGMIAEKSLAGQFADKYPLLCGKQKDSHHVNMRIYKLDKVENISFSPGKMRFADCNDLYFLPYWNISFNSDCGVIVGANDVMGAVENVKTKLEKKTLCIWEDGVPVSQAAMGRRTINGAVVSGVYTPPHYRKKGYATSCVASLSRHLLQNGFKFCCLFTDLANPVSNSIYLKIGYRPVCDYDEYRFI